MNFIREIEPCTSGRIIRGAEGGINYDHYRIKARRERSKAFRAVFAWIGRRLARPAAGRRVEADWLPEAMPRRP